MDTVHVSEEWRPVEGFPYEVSSLGRVRRAGVATREGRPTGGARQGRVLVQSPNGRGYHSVGLWRDGRPWTVLVCVLVCRAFHGPKPSPIHQTRHLDGRKTNDAAGNLVWGTPKENAADKLLHGTHPSGEANPAAKLSAGDAEAIRSAYQGYLAAGRRPPYGWRNETARRYGVSTEMVYRIVNGLAWLPYTPQRTARRARHGTEAQRGS